MATLKGNPLLKFLVIPFVLFAIFIAISLLKGNKPTESETPDSPRLTPAQAKALGVDGDTPTDTLRTIVSESRQLKDQIGQVIQDNQTTKAENEELKRRLNGVDSQVDQRMQNGLNQLKQESQNQTQGVMSSLQKQLDQLSTMGKGTGSANDMPIGLGINPGEGQQFKNAGNSDLIWIDPQDAMPVDTNGQPIKSGSNQTASGFNFPTSFGGSGQKTLSMGVDRVAETIGGDQETRKKVRKVYTLPQNATLMGSISMTALIGRVPVDGTVNDPYPFKILIGPDNLTANGIDLPDVAGAVASGTASGDWTLSCVRGQIKSLTFVFNDGRIRTLPMPQENGNQQNNNQNNQNNQASTNGQPAPVQGGMGWISDPYGIPCISGERRSNSAQYIGSQALITAAGAGAASLIKSDGTTSSYVTNANGTLGTTGISGNEAMGRILGEGVSDISTWVNKLYGQAFAAVYVQPGAKVAVHLDQELAIDYELRGRKVDYHAGASHDSANLD